MLLGSQYLCLKYVTEALVLCAQWKYLLLISEYSEPMLLWQ